MPLLKNRGVASDFSYTNGPMDASKLARKAIMQGYRRLLAVGGDGTVNEVLSGMYSQSAISPKNLTLASAGGGTGDDWLRTLKMPQRIHDLVDTIAQGRTKIVDVGMVSCRSQQEDVQRHFINMAGAGIDAVIANERMVIRAGGFTYLLGLMRVASRYRATVVSITGNGQTIVAPVLTVLVNLGRYGGGGMKIAPHAELDDGLFDTTVVREMAPWRVILESYRLLNGTLFRSPAITCERFSLVTVSGDPSIPVQADGEVIGTTPAHFSILPRALRIIVPGPPYSGG